MLQQQQLAELQRDASASPEEQEALEEHVAAAARDPVHWDAVCGCNTLCQELCLGNAATAAAGAARPCSRAAPGPTGGSQGAALLLCRAAASQRPLVLGCHPWPPCPHTHHHHRNPLPLPPCRRGDHQHRGAPGLC